MTSTNHSESSRDGASAILTPQEAAKHLRVSPSTMYRYLRAGAIPAIRPNKRGVYRIRKTDLDKCTARPEAALTIAQPDTLCQEKNSALRQRAVGFGEREADKIRAMRRGLSHG